MPCHEVSTISVEFKAENIELLKKAAAALGLTIEVTQSGIYVNQKSGNLAVIRDGKATCAASVLPMLNQLRVQYTRESIKFASQKHGWLITAKKDNQLKAIKGM